MRKRISILVTAALALGLVASACGGGTEENGDGGSTTPPETSGEVRVAMQDNVFVPSTLTVASGAELELENEGESEHTFTIEGESIDEELEPGDNANVTVDLDPGTYDFFCEFHQAAGMTGTLTVT